jgi:hypothetical protein
MICSVSASTSINVETSPDHPHDRAEPCAHCGASAAEVWAAERSEMLRELADGGMEISRTVRRLVRAAEPDVGSVAELALAYSRVARTVRQTLALEVRFEEGRKAKERPSDAEALWRQEMEGAGERLRAKLAAVGLYPTRPQGYVEADDADDEERPENLADRPDDDREGFGPDRPVGEVLAGICADLGIERDLSIWADDGVAAPDAPPAQSEPTASSAPVAQPDPASTAGAVRSRPAEARGPSP